MRIAPGLIELAPLQWRRSSRIPDSRTVPLPAVLLYALVLVAVPGTRVVAAAAVSLALCWLVELAQLTPYPGELSARSTLARLVLGSTFSAPDLLYYALGTAGASAVHTSRT